LFDERYISVEGFRVDTINGLGGKDDYAQVDISGSANAYGSDDGVKDALWRTLVAGKGLNGVALPEFWVTVLDFTVTGQNWNDIVLGQQSWNHLCFILACGILKVSNRLLLMYYNLDGEKNESAAIELSKACLFTNVTSINRRLMATTNRCLGLRPVKAEEENIMCILLGSSRPIILRPSGERYLIVGDCYVHGIMEGKQWHGFRRENVRWGHLFLAESSGFLAVDTHERCCLKTLHNVSLTISITRLPSSCWTLKADTHGKSQVLGDCERDMILTEILPRLLVNSIKSQGR
jgi:hypothetical protein